MALRGLLRRKLAAKPMDAKTKKIYENAFNLEKKKIATSRNKAMTAKIQAKARQDARIAAIPKGQRFAVGILSAGKKIGKQIDKFDNDKFEQFVTGKPVKKKKS